MTNRQVVIIGAGPSGVKAASELVKRDEKVVVKIFNGEPDKPYNRSQLSYFLAGDVSLSEIKNDSLLANGRQVECLGRRIEELRADEQLLVDQNGETHTYDSLIIATGSQVRSPNLTGSDKSGVFYFRSLKDAEALKAHRAQNKDTFVIGSGPLGIETALAMKTQRNRVYLQVRSHLFVPELDEHANGVLADFIRSNGIEIITDALVERVLGDDRVSAVQLTDGRRLAVDVVAMCTGIRPSTSLAKDAGIQVGNGILVDDYMRTSAPNVYAIGDCAEHRGITHGVINPGYEQAKTCANHILGSASRFTGERGDLSLKFHNFSSHLLGDTFQDHDEVLVHKNTLKNVYRKLIFDRRRLVGAIIVGEWAETGRVASYIATKQKLPRSARRSFLESGDLWDRQKTSILDQPEDYIVCLCRSVTRGEISACMKDGRRTLRALGEELEAGVTCGSCKPMLSAMLDEPAPNLIMRHYQAILWASVISVLIISLTFLAPKLPFDRSVQFAFQFEKIWYSSIYKQTTGYVLLALVFLGGSLSLRKRWKRLTIGNLDDWRLVHTLLGLVALLALIVHTGFRLGNNLSFVLMVVFLLATLTGSLVGVFMSRNHHWSDMKLNKYRAWWSRIHYSLLWLLPALLGFHILSSYFFA